jgi:hypothetical protein
MLPLYLVEHPDFRANSGVTPEQARAFSLSMQWSFPSDAEGRGTVGLACTIDSSGNMAAGVSFNDLLCKNNVAIVRMRTKDIAEAVDNAVECNPTLCRPPCTVALDGTRRDTVFMPRDGILPPEAKVGIRRFSKAAEAIIRDNLAQGFLDDGSGPKIVAWPGVYIWAMSGQKKDRLIASTAQRFMGNHFLPRLVGLDIETAPSICHNTVRVMVIARLAREGIPRSLPTNAPEFVPPGKDIVGAVAAAVAVEVGVTTTTTVADERPGPLPSFAPSPSPSPPPSPVARTTKTVKQPPPLKRLPTKNNNNRKKGTPRTVSTASSAAPAPTPVPVIRNPSLPATKGRRFVAFAP